MEASQADLLLLGSPKIIFHSNNQVIFKRCKKNWPCHASPRLRVCHIFMAFKVFQNHDLVSLSCISPLPSTLHWISYNSWNTPQSLSPWSLCLCIWLIWVWKELIHMHTCTYTGADILTHRRWNFLSQHLLPFLCIIECLSYTREKIKSRTIPYSSQ